MNKMKRSMSLLLSIMMVLGLFLSGVSTVEATGRTIDTSASDRVVNVIVNQQVEKAFQAGIQYANRIIADSGGSAETGDTLQATVRRQSRLPGADNTQAGGQKDIVSVDSGTVKFHVSNIQVVDEREVRTKLGYMFDYVNEPGVLTQQEINDFMDSLNASGDQTVKSLIIPVIMDRTGANIIGAMKILNPFLSILRVVFGIGVVLIIFLLVGSTVVDLAFIGLPMWRETQVSKADGKGEAKPPLVSYDAMTTVREVEQDLEQGTKNAYLIYLKKRATAYIVLALCVMYLLVGGLGGIITWILTLTSGITG